MLRQVLIVCVLAAAASGQLNRGTLTGQVSDPTGAGVPSASVTVRNQETSATYRAETGASGQYTVPNLPVGIYEVTVEAAGFRKHVRSSIELKVTEVLRIDVELALGSLTEVVEVTAGAPRVQTDSPEVGTSLSNQNIVDLPLSFAGSRSPEVFAYKLSPGVTGNTWTSQINGSTSFSKEVLLDGASVSTYLSGHFGESSVSLEAIQEFKIQTSGMSAEFGRTQGGIFNFVMKSGTNEIHGSAYGALRNEALNANTWVNNFRGVKRTQDRNQNFAGSFGGPIYIPKVYDGRNKTFFYTTYERYRERGTGFGAPNRTFPQPEFYDGDFSRLLGPVLTQTDALGRNFIRGAIYDPATFRQLDSGRWVGEMFPGNRIPVSRFSQVSRRLSEIARKHYTPTIRDATGQIALVNNAVFPSASNLEFDQHQFSTKIDRILTDKHKLAGSYTYVARPRLRPGSGLWDPNDRLGGPLSGARIQRVASQLPRVAWDWTVSPRLLNNVTAFYNRQANPHRTVYWQIDGAKELGIRNISTFGYPVVNWGGGPFVSLTNSGDTHNSFQGYGGSGISNTASWIKGRHFVKFGADFRWNYLNNVPSPGGSFTFAARGTAVPAEAISGTQIGYSFASFLLGIVDTAGRSFPVAQGGRRRYVGLFIQDDFKLSRTFTVNAGLRWEFQPPYVEQYDRIATWSPFERDPQSGLMGAYRFAGSCQMCTGQRWFGVKSYDDFGPRIGFAWQAFKGWTIRGGYGIFWDADLFDGYSATAGGSSFPWGGSFDLAADPVTPWRGIFNWDNGFPLDRFIPGSFDRSNANRAGAVMISPRYGDHPYTQQWNFNIQKELPWRLLIDLGYVGNQATRIQNNNIVRLNQIRASALTEFGRNLLNTVQNESQAAANRIAYPFPGFRGIVAGAIRDFPQLPGISTIGPYGAPEGFSNYNSLQITVNRQFAKGLTIYANYVWSKNLANTLSSMESDNSGSLDYYNLRLEKAPTTFDFPHNFKGYVQYELPIGRGQAIGSGMPRWANAILSGWAVSAILNYNSGAPLGFGGASNPLPSAWNGGQRPNIAAGSMKNPSFSRGEFNFANTAAASNTLLNKSLFSDPAALTLGNAAPRYTQIRGFATRNEDIGIMKNSRINEKFRYQIRAEALNALNRHTLGGIITSVTNPQFGQVTSISGNRTLQVGMRLDF